MGKRYYCDFCDRSFADSGVNRKNHFKGSLHQRLRKQHYDAFRDPATILAENAMKPPCSRFQQHGACDYQDNCKFSHMTPERLSQLKTQIAREREGKRKKEEGDSATPTVQEWLAKRRKRSKKDDTPTPGETTSSDITYELPPFLSCIPNLPPSLLPPTAEELMNVSNCDWG